MAPSKSKDLPTVPPPEFAHLRIESSGSLQTKPQDASPTDTPHVSVSSEPSLTLSRPALSPSPRNQSPVRPGHRSPVPRIIAATTAGAPPMQRAHSSPGVDSTGRFVAPSTFGRRPASPLNQYGRRRSPLRTGVDDSYQGTPSWSGISIEPDIPEDEQLDIHSGNYPLASVSETEEFDPPPVTGIHHTFPRSRRHPMGPLHASASAPSLYARAVSPSIHSGWNSPSLVEQKYGNEPYPACSIGSASSMPSTPTSFRSRSPSISSLETIEDSPNAELEAEEEVKMRSEDGDAADGAGRRRSSLELRGTSLRSNKERKRWSVCGAERRADFSLEPIEE